jgi:hypothetical protein
LAEVKLIRGAKLSCTEKQAYVLEKFDRPPFLHAVIIGYHVAKGVLYIGKPEWKLTRCRYIPRPRTLASSEWWITELLGKWHADYKEEQEAVVALLFDRARRGLAGEAPKLGHQSHARLRRRPKANPAEGARAGRRAPAEVVEQPARTSAGGYPRGRALPEA